ncbi:DNA-methyltransferase [Microbulbifer sp. SSSA002]|uniref:DNA-methyltransferase n=1 Tax=Microbulbifer sp. SSSA002 TaxID=3243376 RepID=UPI00403A2779
MGYSNQFFGTLGVKPGRGGNLAAFSRACDVPVDRLKYYNNNNIVPSGLDLKKIIKVAKVSELALRLKMGRLDRDTISLLQENSDDLLAILNDSKESLGEELKQYDLVYKTRLGKLYQGDCISLMREMKDDSMDLVFADPPFNLDKLYPSKIDDNLKTEKYLYWCEKWLSECIRLLKPGGALFLWNLPKWNSSLTGFLDGHLTFRNWIAVDIKYSLPIQGRLYPSHYSLLYYIKGEKPNSFSPDRLPMQTCPKCYGDLKDYGGYKSKMNPKGVNLTDVWIDIPPVRHAKYKRRNGANELSLKLLDRVIEMASREGDVVFDPFGGSGTTYMAAELKKRKWVGCEIGPVDDIVERFGLVKEERDILQGYRGKVNSLFIPEVKEKRETRGLWTSESVQAKKSSS